MPKKKQVPMLVDLVSCFVREFVITETKLISMTSKTNSEYGCTKLHSMLEFIKHLLNSRIPRHLYDKISIAVLTAIRNLVEQECERYRLIRDTGNDSALTTADNFIPEMVVALRLTEVAVGAHLKAIEFSAWPLIMHYQLYYKLNGMFGLEILDLGPGWLGDCRPSDIEEVIASGVSAMPNLVCFILHLSCTNKIISALAKNCKKLQKLDVTDSESVTERSVGPLLSCKHLRHIKLHRTSMSTAGYANLFLDLKIEDIGRCDKFGDVLEHIHQKDIGIKSSFNIRTLDIVIDSAEHLYLLIDMCPYITNLCLRYCGDTDDLSILATLDYLKELKLIYVTYWNFYTNEIKTLLEMKGCAITSLHLYHVQGIDSNALILISQYCPDIKDIVFDNCELVGHATLDPRKLAVRPFRFLERIKCAAKCTHMYLEFLFSYCINIKSIELGESTEIGDDAMRRILLLNPMSKLEELKILYGPDLTMETVRLLMQNCDNLRHLSELESWEGISPKELDIFREDLEITNTILDTTPSSIFTVNNWRL